MTRSCRLRKGDLRKTIEAVKAAGEDVARVEVDRDGKVIVVVGKPEGADAGTTNEWDSVLRGQD
jgi:hypothetical protein